MAEVFQTITVSGDGITLPLLIWRRFQRPMPGLLERAYADNPRIADLGPVLQVGTTVKLLIPEIAETTEVAEKISLW